MTLEHFYSFLKFAVENHFMRIIMPGLWQSGGLASYGLGGKMRGDSKGFGMEGIKRILRTSCIQHQSLAPVQTGAADEQKD